MVYMHDFLHLRQRLHHTVLMIRVYLVLSANREFVREVLLPQCCCFTPDK